MSQFIHYRLKYETSSTIVVETGETAVMICYRYRYNDTILKRFVLLQYSSLNFETRAGYYDILSIHMVYPALCPCVCFTMVESDIITGIVYSIFTESFTVTVYYYGSNVALNSCCRLHNHSTYCICNKLTI